MTRSWWGWGSVEEAVTPAESAELLARVREFLPGAELSPHAAPGPGVTRPAARRGSLPRAPLAGLCSDDPSDRAAHTTARRSATWCATCTAQLANPPDLVVRPRTEQDVVDVLDWCSRERLAVIPYGGGSSVVGGVEARFDGPARVARPRRPSTGCSRSTGPAGQRGSRPGCSGRSSRTSSGRTG